MVGTPRCAHGTDMERRPGGGDRQRHLLVFEPPVQRGALPEPDIHPQGEPQHFALLHAAAPAPGHLHAFAGRGRHRPHAAVVRQPGTGSGRIPHDQPPVRPLCRKMEHDLRTQHLPVEQQHVVILLLGRGRHHQHHLQQRRPFAQLRIQRFVLVPPVGEGQPLAELQRQVFAERFRRHGHPHRPVHVQPEPQPRLRALEGGAAYAGRELFDGVCVARRQIGKLLLLLHGH